MINKRNFTHNKTQLGGGMKPLFTLLTTITIILVVSFLTMATSCGNTGGGNNNNSGGGDNGGGGGNGNDTPQPVPGIVITEINDDVARTNGKDIILKTSGFPTAAANDIVEGGYLGFQHMPENSLERAFDIAITDGTALAKGGLVFVSPGSINPDTLDLSPRRGTLSIDRLDKDPTGYTGDDREGIFNAQPVDAVGANFSLPTGWNIFGVFMNGSIPTGNPNSPNFGNESPIGFTAVRKIGKDNAGVKPFLLCRTTISTITSKEEPNPANDDGRVKEGTVLTGGQKASCFVGATGSPFTKPFADAWLNTAAAGGGFKSKFNISALGIKTDEKTIAQIGLDGKNDANDDQEIADVTDFWDGLSTKDIDALKKNNTNFHQTFSVTIERDAEFKYTTPRLIFANINDNAVEIENGTNIKLKVSGFPKTAVSDRIDYAGMGDSLYSARPTYFTKVFDITIIGGDQGDVDVEDGLVLVDTGDTGDKADNDFTTDPIDRDANEYTGDLAIRLVEGMFNNQPTATKSDNDIFPVGWSIFSLFMNRAVPTSTTTSADKSPFAFTELDVNGVASKPVFFCRTTVDTITSLENDNAGRVQDSTVLEGGQKASCYIASFGAPFTDLIADKWLQKSPADNFKKTFNIAALGIKTDGKTIAELGLDKKKDDDETSLATAAADFREGLGTKDVTALLAANTNAHQKYSVEIVRDDAFTYKSPEIAFDFGENPVAKLVKGTGGNIDTIKIKATSMPEKHGFIATDVDLTVESTVENDVNSFKHIFDITIEGGVTDGSKATGGLIMVGPGNIGGINSFSDTSGAYDKPATAAERKEGFYSGTAGYIDYAGGAVQKSGWNFYGAFMNETLADVSTFSPDVSPFAFSSQSGAVQPLIFCRTTIPSIKIGYNLTSGDAILDTTTLEGGQTASCYLSYRAIWKLVTVDGKTSRVYDAFDAASWLAQTGNHIKRAFNISIGGIRTDTKTVLQIGLPTTGSEATDNENKRENLRNGLTAEEVTAIAAANPSAYKKVKLELVSDAKFDEQ